MFRTVFFKTSKRISETLIGAVLFLISESTFIYSVRKFGVLYTVLIFSFIYSIVSLFLFSWFLRESSSSSMVGRITRWAIQKANAVQKKYARLITASKLIAVLVASALAGAFVTTILIGLLGYRGRRAVIFIVLQTMFTETVWALFYAGGLRLIFGR